MRSRITRTILERPEISTGGPRAFTAVVLTLTADKSTSAITAARDGLAISLFNPKILLFFPALFSRFVSETESMGGKASILITPVLVDGL